MKSHIMFDGAIFPVSGTVFTIEKGVGDKHAVMASSLVLNPKRLYEEFGTLELAQTRLQEIHNEINRCEISDNIYEIFELLHARMG